MQPRRLADAMLSTATAAKYNSLWIMLSLACACGVLYVLALTHRRDRDRARPDADPERIQVRPIP